MRCLLCGHKFLGEIYDDCPECFSPNTEEVDSEIDDDQEHDYLIDGGINSCEQQCIHEKGQLIYQL
jgi:hypothetical protein